MYVAESVGEVDNFEKPITQNINSDYKFYIDLFQEKFVDIYLMPFTVESQFGLFWDTTTTISSITLSDVLQDSTNRDPGTKTLSKEGQDSERSANYLNLNILGSNKQRTTSRQYTKLIDVFSDVGGLAEIISFFIALFYSWYNSLRMEVYLLNKGVLQSDHLEQELRSK